MREPGTPRSRSSPSEIHSDDAVPSASAMATRASRLPPRRVEAEAHYSDRGVPGPVDGTPLRGQKVNWPTHDVGDPLIGTPEYKVSAVRVEPIGR